MAEEITKDDFEIADPELDVPHYLATYKDLNLDREKHELYIQEEVPLEARTAIQEILDKNPAILTPQQLHDIYLADAYLIRHADQAAQWVRPIPNRDEEPKNHWWWWLDEVADGLREPDPEKEYNRWLEKAGYTD